MAKGRCEEEVKENLRKEDRGNDPFLPTREQETGVGPGIPWVEWPNTAKNKTKQNIKQTNILENHLDKEH